MTMDNVKEFDRINIKGKELPSGFSFSAKNDAYYLIVDKEKDIFIYNTNGALIATIFNKPDFMLFFELGYRLRELEG